MRDHAAIGTYAVLMQIFEYTRQAFETLPVIIESIGIIIAEERREEIAVQHYQENYGKDKNNNKFGLIELFESVHMFPPKIKSAQSQRSNTLKTHT